MIGHSTLRLTFTLVTCLMFLSRGFVIDKRIASQDVRNFQDLNRLNNYDDEDYEDDLLKNNYYYDRGMNAMNSNKREFSPDKLRQQVRDKMEAIVRGKDVSSFFDDDIESEMFDSMMRKMMKDKHEAMKNIGNLKSSSSFREEKSSQTKIESNGNKGVAVVTGQSMESSSSGNGSNPLVKVAKVVAVATKDGKENGEWKMKPIEEEVQVITPAPEDGKQALKNVGGDDDDEEKFKSLFEQDDRGLFHGHDFDRLFGPEEVERSPRNKRSILAAEEPKKSANDVDLLKNYIALQDAENRHLMQALDLASEIELNNEDDPRTIDEQMYHMRKALEEERSLSAIRKQIQLSIKNSGAKRSPYMFKQNDYPAEDLQKYAVPGDNDDDDDYDNGADYSFLKRYSKRRVSGAEDYNDDDDGDDDDDDVIEEGETVKEDEDGNLMEEWAGDITLDRHKLRNEELIDRLKEMMSQSDEGWKSISRSKKPHPVDHSVDELLDEESLRNLLRSYRKNYKTLNDDKVLPLIFPDDDEEYDEGDIDPQLRRKILENMARHSISDFRLNPLFRNITKVEFPEKRFFQENRPMVSSSDEDVENTEPWCPKAAKLVDNCLYARLNGLLPDSEAVDLCNAHQLCYKCGSSNGVTSEECDRAFMERSKELCLDEMACKKQAASLYVTMMADRQFYTEFEAPDVCTDPCVTSILYTDRSD